MYVGSSKCSVESIDDKTNHRGRKQSSGRLLAKSEDENSPVLCVTYTLLDFKV